MMHLILITNLVTLTLYFIIAPLLLRNARVPHTAAFNVLMAGWAVVFAFTTIGTVIVMTVIAV